MKKILITGGPVHAYLDPVKIITNRFKGGRMAELADNLGAVAQNKIWITYLTAQQACIPDGVRTTVVYHNGFEDYRKKVLELAPKHDAVILGAAVCNLIPIKPWKKKFPSHNYKVGDIIPIDFTIAPRVIDEVKKVAPKTNLFGFKLLQGVKHKELIQAAYDIVLESGAVAVFANDANDLDTRHAVTKEGGEIKFSKDRVQYGIEEFILNCISDKYYSTLKTTPSFSIIDYRASEIKMCKLTKKYKSKFLKKYGKEKYRFGTIAVRLGSDNSFITTGRGKKEMDEIVIVEKVDHVRRKVYATDKATLNAPLLHNLFKKNRNIKAIVHYHEQSPNNVAWSAYAPAGTSRDASLANNLHPSHRVFQIEGHGTFELLTGEEL